MAERDSSLYGLQKLTLVAVLSRLQITDSAVPEIVFDIFPSLAAFAAGDVPPIDRLRLRLTPSSADLEPYTAVINAVRAKALDILGLGGRGYTLTNLFIDTLAKVLVISAESPARDHRPTDVRDGAEYDTTLAANQDLVYEAMGVAWTYGKTHDAFLAAMTAV